VAKSFEFLKPANVSTAYTAILVKLNTVEFWKITARTM